MSSEKPTGSRRPAALRYVAEDGDTGYAIAGERLVRALRAAGVDVELRALETGLAGRSGLRAHSREDPPRAGDRAVAGAPTIVHMVPEHIEAVRRLSPGPIVSHTVWETDRLPRHWPAILNETDGVIVPTEWNREIFRSSGVRAPIAVVPHVATELAGGRLRRPLPVPDGHTVFYLISRWVPRKAPTLAVGAFLGAFTAEDPVALVVKTSVLAEQPPTDRWGSASERFMTTDWQIAWMLRHHPNPPRVHLIVEDWDDAEIAALHARGDCYLALSHGEGWDIGAFDACAAGNPVVATGWGGVLAYLEGSSTLVEYDLGAVVHAEVGSYSPDQSWAYPRLHSAIEALRAVAADLPAARAAAATLRERLCERYRGAVVAERFLAALEGFALPVGAGAPAARG